LHYAADYGQKDVAELLLAKGASINAKADDGSTPLSLAAAKGHQDVAKLLRQHGGHE
jgi:ankyrin repeat protein